MSPKQKLKGEIITYKLWLDLQTDSDPEITFVCKHCGENIELGDGGFMSWNYSNLADHLEECESAQEDEEFMSKPEGFDDDGNNYPRAQYCGTVG